MSYSCTSREAVCNSQDPSSAKIPSSSNNPRSISSGGDSGGQANPPVTMKVKKGCNSTDVGVPVTTEEDLLSNSVITPEDVLGLQKITESKL